MLRRTEMAPTAVKCIFEYFIITEIPYQKYHNSLPPNEK